MSNVIIDRQKIDILANAISDKSGVPVTMTLAEMVEAVDSIKTGGGEPNLQAKTYTVNSAGTETITADSGYDGLSGVAISVPSISGWEGALFNRNNYVTVSGTRYWQPSVGIETFGDGWVDAGVYSELQIFNAVKSGTAITPTESAQTVGGANYMMEGAVTVNAIPSNYVGSSITRRDDYDMNGASDQEYYVVAAPAGYYPSQAEFYIPIKTSSDLTVSGATITVPAGYYSAAASKSVTSGSVTAPTSISGTAASVSTGTNTLTLTKTVSVTPNITTAGYINSGTAGNSSVSLTANITTKAAATITPTTTNQTIAAGTYLTGTQTIVGDADLIGSNILSTANIFGVQGTVVVYNYYTGSSTPSSSLGENGDLYFQTED